MHDAKHLLEQHSCYLAASENTVTLKNEITEDFNDVEPEKFKAKRTSVPKTCRSFTNTLCATISLTIQIVGI